MRELSSADGSPRKRLARKSKNSAAGREPPAQPKRKEIIMKYLRRFTKTITTAACGALLLSLLAGAVLAGPTGYVLWPKGANLVLNYDDYDPYPGGLGPFATAQWPPAKGVDHYRLTVVFKSGGVSSVYTTALDASRTDCVVGSSKGNYLVTVTAYSGPDETLAYCESLQGRVTAR
jgi:hypothetical protein